MAIKEPESMDELVYFTNRKVGDGHIKAWVYRRECLKCGKALMGKPVDEKTGKPKIRAKEYVCPECNYTVDKEEYEDTLTCEIKYTCPKCKHQGEAEVPFQRKKIKKFDEVKNKKIAVDAIVFNCESCGEKIPITKKLK
jgi:uncharacterized CHY-type Zn-finger protein